MAELRLGIVGAGIAARQLLPNLKELAGPHRGRAPAPLELHDAVTQNRPTPLDARWGMATTAI